MRVLRLGFDPHLVDYVQAWDRQRSLHAARVAGDVEDTVLLLEHEPVYTAGKRTAVSDRPAPGSDPGAPVIDVDRGGRITWHGPGQLTGYPIMALPSPVDVLAFVRAVEEVMLRSCADLGLPTTRIEGRSGVWVTADDRGGDRKVGAVGLRVAQGVTMHGFAINADCDLGWFDRIVPCGIADAGVTSLSAELGRRVTAEALSEVVEQHLPALSLRESLAQPATRS